MEVKKMSKEMKEYRVDVRFTGIICVNIPADARFPQTMAEQIALSRVSVQMEENPSAQDSAATEFYEEYIEGTIPEISEEEILKKWDESEAWGPDGEWEVIDEV